jgi:hypothetical protein
MPRVRRLLRDLFRQTLTESGREAPALVDITIERVPERFAPRLVAHFSNGHRASTPVTATDFHEFCQRHSTRDLDSLRAALLSEGHEIHAHMIESRINAGTRDPRGQPVDQAEAHESSASRTLREWWGRRWNVPRRAFSFRNTNPEAEARGIRLLNEHLSPAQRNQYKACGYFDVVGGSTGKRYRINNGSQMNVEELDKKGIRQRLLCFMPEGDLVVGDVMLAQKYALELFESYTLTVANRLPAQPWL